jgi:thymidylate kinase
VDANKLEKCLDENFKVLSKKKFLFLEGVLTSNSSVLAFFKAGKVLKKELRGYRDHNEFTSIRKAFFRLYSIRFFSLLRKLRIYDRTEGKKVENGGRIIAFVGGDGAGKTTTISNLKKTLKKQFSLKSIHVGKPKMTFKGLFLRIVSKALSIVGAKDLSKALFFLAIAYNRKNEFRKACKLRDRGIIVLQDRIPLQGITAMDCPRVHSIANGKYKRISKLEKKQYKSIKGVDMLFVMKLNPEIALQRRPEDDQDELRIRSGQIWNNNWVAKFAHEIDTGENNPEDVQNILLKKVWKNFNKPFVRGEILGLNGTGKSTLFEKIESKIPNVLRTMPVKRHPFLIIKGVVFYSFSALRIWLKTKDMILLNHFLHLMISIQIVRSWKAKKSFPAKNFIFDQGPYFQSALLYKEGAIVKKRYLELIGELERSFPMLFKLTASNEVLYERVANREDSDGRGQYLNFEEFCAFCEDYDESFKVLRKKIGSYTKINTEKKSLTKTYKIFKKKAYGYRPV